MGFITITNENIDEQHLCCAMSDKKHQQGVSDKKTWLKQRIQEGHIFRKLDDRGKVFIEYAPLEKAWVPVIGDNFMHIYCLWVSGKFTGSGYGKQLLQSCIDDAKKQCKSGVCIVSSKKKKPYFCDKKFLVKQGFVCVDTMDDYEVLALSFDGSTPQFSESAKKQSIDAQDLTIYYGSQCPYIPNCIEQVENYCKTKEIPLNLIKVDTLEKAKTLPCVFNNWAVFYKGIFETTHLLNEGYLKKLLAEDRVKQS